MHALCGGDVCSVRQRCKGLHPDIDADSFADGWEQRWSDRTRDTRVPAVSFANDGAGFGCAVKWAVVVQSDCTDLGEDESPPVQRDPVAPLWVGKTVVPTLALEPGVAWCLASFEAPKERLKCPIHTVQYVLKHLRMHTRQIARIALQRGQTGRLTSKANRLTPLFPSRCSFSKRMVVEMAARLHRLCQTRPLSGCQTQLVDERFQLRVLCASI